MKRLGVTLLTLVFSICLAAVAQDTSTQQLGTDTPAEDVGGRTWTHCPSTETPLGQNTREERHRKAWSRSTLTLTGRSPSDRRCTESTVGSIQSAEIGARLRRTFTAAQDHLPV